MDLLSVLKTLNSIAPLAGAAQWDNVGLLLEPAKSGPVRRLLITNDLTPEVWSEAEKAMPDVILSYHPPIFRPMKRLVQKDWKARILLACARNDVAVYSPHTALDDVDGGINDWLLKAFGDVIDVTSILPPTDSQKEVGFRGSGRMARLPEPLPLSECRRRLQRHLQIDQLMTTKGVDRGADPQITSVAVCAGSGGSLLGGLPSDLLVTGEMGHHELLDAKARGCSVLLTTHSRSERRFLWTELAPKLRHAFDSKVEVAVAENDADPIVFENE